MFALETTVTLYDLTNTSFEGDAAGNHKGQRGHSKEKRSACPLVTLGLQSPEGALVTMDRGIATESNIAWLADHHYRYLLVSREGGRRFDTERPVEVVNKSGGSILVQRIVNEAATEARLSCYSSERQEKEAGISSLFTEKFENGLAKLVAGLTPPRREKPHDRILQRIRRLQEKSHGSGRHCRIDVIRGATGDKAVALSWEKVTVAVTMLTHPGVYCPGTNELRWDEKMLWQT